jgi:poly-beta-1,6-N-acetyl-D-glucosamine biosynthesis protein PgaD
MSASLIIDARHRLPWHQRLLSDASTALLWSGWLWLWIPLLRAWTSLADVGARVGPALVKLAGFAPDEMLGASVVALLGTSGTLIVWNRLPGRRVRAAPVLSLREHARHFRLPEHDLRASREAAICVVHHDAEGRIVRLERRDVVAPAASRAA